MTRNLLFVTILLLFQTPASAADNQPYPEFQATYEASISGITIAEATFSLRKLDNGEFIYEQKSIPVGVASLLGKNSATASSRWRFVDNQIQALEYQSENENGDADDNLHLIFDWESAQVRNISEQGAWQTSMPKGTLDKMIMQMALLFAVREGGTEFQFPVAHQGRIKHYRFARKGEERITLPFGEYDTLVLERLDDDRDQSTIWSAPDLNYFPVRFLKHKKSGVKIELLLREVAFVETGDPGHTPHSQSSK